MASFSFKTLLKVVSKEELQELASSSLHIDDLCKKLNLNKMQIRYLYLKAGIELSLFKSKKLIPNPAQIFSKEDLIVHIGKPLQVVCKELNLKPKKVINLFTENNLPAPIKSNNFASKCPVSKQDLEHEYLTLKKSLNTIGEKYNVSKQQVSNWLYFYQIPVRTRGFIQDIPRKTKKHPMWSWTDEEFLNKVKSSISSQDFCKKENISYALFNNFIKERGIKPPFPKQKFLFTKEYIIDLYLVKSMTIKEIAEQEGCHWQTINRCLKAFGLTGSKPKTWLKRKRKKIQ